MSMPYAQILSTSLLEICELLSRQLKYANQILILTPELDEVHILSAANPPLRLVSKRHFEHRQMDIPSSSKKSNIPASR